MRFTCGQYRALLPAYIQRELSPKQRARVSRHLNTCSECYVAYVEQRQLVRDLEFNVPRIGGDRPRLDKIRTAVMAEVAQPGRPDSHMRRYQARYSVAAIILMLALLLPWSIHNHSFALPTQPRPENNTPQGTTMVAVLLTRTVTLTATLQSNYAPMLSATDTP